MAASSAAALALPALLLLLLAEGLTVVSGKGAFLKSRCDKNEMTIVVPLPENGTIAYLHNLKSVAGGPCWPQIVDQTARIRVQLGDGFECGITRITNQLTGMNTYLASVAVLAADDTLLGVYDTKCSVPGGAGPRARRNVLPAGFQEEEVLEVRPVETTVQAPHLGVEVRQGGQLVTGELNVNPGTPLTMEISLDDAAAPIYGLLVTHMTVSDTKAQEETIIFNGCSVDPYLFDNFNTVDGDFLSAKFRAFKFPESSFVQFRGTVSVCLDKCRGVECSNGVIGYGRKRRDVASLPPDPNKVFEVALSAFIKVDYEKENEANMEKSLVEARSDAPAAAESGNVLGTIPAASSGMEVAKEELPSYTVLASHATSTSSPASLLLLVSALISFLKC